MVLTYTSSNHCGTTDTEGSSVPAKNDKEGLYSCSQTSQNGPASSSVKRQQIKKAS